VLVERFLDALIPGITLGCIYALFAVGFVVLYSVTKLFNIIIGEFGMLGGMIGATLYLAGLPLFVAVIGGIVASTLIGAGVWQIVFLRPWARGYSITNMKLITMTLLVISVGAAQVVWGTWYKDLPPFTEFTLMIGSTYIGAQDPWIWGILLLVVTGLVFFFDRTLVGKALRACADQPVAASLVGIKTNSMAFYAFVLSAALGAIAGIVVVPVTKVHYAQGIFFVFYGLLAAMAGGPTKFEGAIAGGLFLGIIESLAGAFISAKFMTVIAVGSFVLLLIIRPQGILAAKEEEI
jgi:branched-chain amino acid transport system permease protein